MSDPLAPFRALADEGAFPFFWRPYTASVARGYVLRGGAYDQSLSPGKGALTIERESGQPLMHLTVNLRAPAGLEYILDEGEFHAKRYDDGDEEMRGTRLALLRVGLFVDARRTVSAGFVKQYADVWRFARCPHDEHGHRGFAVLCPSCRAGMREDYENERELIAVGKTIRALKKMPTEAPINLGLDPAPWRRS